MWWDSIHCGRSDGCECAVRGSCLQMDENDLYFV